MHAKNKKHEDVPIRSSVPKPKSEAQHWEYTKEMLVSVWCTKAGRIFFEVIVNRILTRTRGRRACPAFKNQKFMHKKDTHKSICVVCVWVERNKCTTEYCWKVIWYKEQAIHHRPTAGQPRKLREQMDMLEAQTRHRGSCVCAHWGVDGDAWRCNTSVKWYKKYVALHRLSDSISRGERWLQIVEVVCIMHKRSWRRRTACTSTQMWHMNANASHTHNTHTGHASKSNHFLNLWLSTKNTHTHESTSGRKNN